MKIKTLCSLLLACSMPATMAHSFSDPLNTPARQVAAPHQQPYLDSVPHPQGVLAVGPRGLLVRLDPEPIQIPLPVSSDLTGVYFADEQHGWIAGHDGVILHSADGGQHWTKQLDGNQALNDFVRYYEQWPEAEGDGWIHEIRLNLGQGATLPFLDIHFASSTEGIAAGAFGLIAYTRDGGQHWQPFNHGLDNPGGLHLNAVTTYDGHWIIAAEGGALFIGSPEQLPIPKIQTPYAGSFFGALGFDGRLYAYGMRGNLWSSANLEEWQQENTPARGSFSAAATDGKLLVLATSAGEVIWKVPGAENFSPLPVAPGPFTAITLTGHEVLLFSLRGITRTARPDLPSEASAPGQRTLPPTTTAGERHE